MKKTILILPVLILACQGMVIGQTIEDKVKKGVQEQQEQRQPSSVRTTDPNGNTREMVFRGPNGAPMRGLPAPKVREDAQEQPEQRQASAVRTTDSDGNTRVMEFRGPNGAPMYGLPAPERGTPLMDAAFEGDVKQMETLLDSGAEIDATDKQGRTALMFAAANGAKDAVVLLAERGANVNAKDNGGDTPLMYAILGGDDATINTLLAYGATYNPMQ